MDTIFTERQFLAREMLNKCRLEEQVYRHYNNEIETAGSVEELNEIMNFLITQPQAEEHFRQTKDQNDQLGWI